MTDEKLAGLLRVIRRALLMVVRYIEKEFKITDRVD